MWYSEPEPRYWPAMKVITDITKAKPVVITTDVDHEYEDGLIVRLYVPKSCGMIQLNHFTGKVSVVSANTFSMDIDTTTYDSFLAPSSPPYYRKTALVVPIGSINDINLAVRNDS